MTVLKSEIRPGTYADSIILMQLQSDLKRLPGVIAAGVRLAIGRGLVGMVVAEFYTTISGLGFMITRYANVFDMDRTFVPVLMLVVLGVSLTSGLKVLERRLAPWSSAHR